jgi:hypothetical protein
MNRNTIIKLSKITGKKTKFKYPNDVYRKLMDYRKHIGLPLTDKEMAMVSFLSIAFKFNEDIEVLYNYIENDLFMIKFDVITETNAEIDCDPCGGSGEYECFNCNGTGEVEDEEENESECYYCDGTGEVQCDNCGGTGYFSDENSVFKDVVTCFSYDKNYFNKFELNTSGVISSVDYDIFLENEKTIFIVNEFGKLDKYNYQFDTEVGDAYIVDLIKL